MLRSNARMYEVAPAAAAAWAALFERVARDAGVPLAPLAHPAPLGLEALWARDDLGCCFMCGLPWFEAAPRPVPLAAPVPDRWGAAVYATDFVVRADSRYETLEDTFGGRIGWTVGHSQSGCSAPRHHLLAHRTATQPRLYAESVGPLVTAPAVVAAVLDRRIDVGPLDGYWHALLRLHAPDRAAGLRTVASTVTAPIPLLVASPGVPADGVARLRAALLALPPQPALAMRGFAAVRAEDYAILPERARAALAAGYELPA